MIGESLRKAAGRPSGVHPCSIELRHASVPFGGTALRRLVARVVGRSPVVMLGESHHFVHETFVSRWSIMEVLGVLGFSRVGLEVSRTDGARLNAYLASGERELLDRVGVFGALGSGDRPYDGVLGVGADRYPFAGLRAETTAWLDELRRDGRSWSLFGFDLEYLPGLASERLAATVDPTERCRGQATLDASLCYDQAVRRASSYAELTTPMAWREALMVDHVLHELAQRPGDRTVLIGHNLHVGAGSDRIVLSGAVGPGGGLVSPLGAQLARRGVTGPCIWTLHDHGEDSGPPPGDGAVHGIPGTLNRFLAEVSIDPVVIRTGEVACMQQRWTIASMYGATIDAVPAEVCDLVVSMPVTTRLRADSPQ